MAMMTCPDCGKEISDQAPACPNCGRPATPRPATAPPRPSTGTTKNIGCGKSAVILIFVIMIVVVISALMIGHHTGGSSTGASSSSSYKAVGEERRLRTGTAGPSAAIFATENTLNEVRAAGTDRSLAAVIMGGGAFLVDQSTRVLILEAGSDTTKIRVLDGPMVGRTGFVPSNWCRE